MIAFPPPPPVAHIVFDRIFLAEHAKKFEAKYPELAKALREKDEPDGDSDKDTEGPPPSHD